MKYLLFLNFTDRERSDKSSVTVAGGFLGALVAIVLMLLAVVHGTTCTVIYTFNINLMIILLCVSNLMPVSCPFSHNGWTGVV